MHAYAMGSAVTNCFPGKSNCDVHNRMLTVEEMDENDLVTLYVLPDYERVLKRFGLSELRVCGYGLRYGDCLWKHRFRFT